MLKIFAFSDSHTQHNLVKIPECDVLVFAGDAEIRTFECAVEFLNWIKNQQPTHKVFVAGNHDLWIEDNSRIFRQLCEERDIIYLEHESCEIEGVKFFGSPYTPQFCNWAFMESRDKLVYMWEQIPENTNVLITHGPMYGMRDRCPDSVGCIALKNKISRLRKKDLRLHIFGHIHEDAGSSRVGKIRFMNVGILDGCYQENDVEEMHRIARIMI